MAGGGDQQNPGFNISSLVQGKTPNIVAVHQKLIVNVKYR